MHATDRAAPRAFLIDLAFVVAFVVVGRRSHDEGPAVTEALTVLAPFAIGLVIAWLTGRKRWATPHDRAFAVQIWAVTVIVGLVLRRVVFDRGIAIAFVIVVTVFLGLAFIGWRAAAARRHDQKATVPTDR